MRSLVVIDAVINVLERVFLVSKEGRIPETSEDIVPST